MKPMNYFATSCLLKRTVFHILSAHECMWFSELALLRRGKNEASELKVMREPDMELRLF